MFKKTDPLTQILVAIAAFCIVLGPGLVFLFTRDGNTAKPASVQIPVSMTGKWHQDEPTSTGITMEATIDVTTIQIDMITRDSSSIYWLGTFDSDQDLSTSFEVVSVGDQDAMSRSIFGSQSSRKTFAYNDGELSYSFSIMGTTSTIRLTK